MRRHSIASRKRNYKRRGGYSSAATFQVENLGGVSTQLANSITPNSNVITNVQGQRAGRRTRRTRRSRR